MWGLLIAKRLDQSYDRSIKNSELWLGPIYYTLFWRCTTVLRLLPALASQTNLVPKNEFPELKQAHFNFLAINFTVWNHIPITVAADALTPYKRVAEPRVQGVISNCQGITQLAANTGQQHGASPQYGGKLHTSANPLDPSNKVIGYEIRQVKPLVEIITQIGLALNYCLMCPYFGNTLDLVLYPTHKGKTYPHGLLL